MLGGCLLRVFKCARVFINCVRVLGCLLNVLECTRVFIKGVRVC